MKTFDGVLEEWVRRWTTDDDALKHPDPVVRHWAEERNLSRLLPGAVEALRDDLIEIGWVPPIVPPPPPCGGGDHPSHIHPNQLTVDDYVDPNVMREH